MKDLMKEILTNKSSRNSCFLTLFIAETFNAGQPWG
jgi:hypothetical protein